jgi:hypothetical protein
MGRLENPKEFDRELWIRRIAQIHWTLDEVKQGLGLATFKELCKMIKVLTTFHKAGLDLYGQRFIDSFAKNVDKQIKLLVYAENCTPVNPDSNQIKLLMQKN